MILQNSNVLVQLISLTPLLNRENNIFQFLKHLVLINEIIQDTFGLFKPVGSIRTRIYGLPKLHKKAVPLRPILSMINASQHKLAKLLNVRLEPILKYYSNYVLTPSHLLKELKILKPVIPFSASFDVKSRLPMYR